MKELIRIQETPKGKQVVSAKNLHDFLGIKTELVLWCKRMFDYGFNENEDYAVIKSENPVNKQVGITDFALTIDTAKEISMIQRTDKGKQARKYFIDVEKKYKRERQQQQQHQIPQTYSQALMLAAKQAEKLELQQSKINKLEPKAEFYDSVTSSKSAIDIGRAAKVLDMGLGRNKLFQKLRNKGVLMHDNVPYQSYVDRGYFRIIETKFTKPDGSTHIQLKTLVYQKGLDYIRKILSD